MSHDGHNMWKGWTLGLIGGAAGVAAMDAFMSRSGKFFEEWAPAEAPRQHDDVSLVGRQSHDDESPTAAVGRLLFEKVMGREPRSEETKEFLSTLVHWTYGIKVGGFYGALRRHRGPDVSGGLAYGAALWAIGDEGAVPLFGLAEGPRGQSPAMHLKSLAGHFVYGLAMATATGLLKNIFRRV